MKKKIIAMLLLAVILAFTVALPASAATYISLWQTSNMSDSGRSITQETAYLFPTGYAKPQNVLDLDNGVSDKDFAKDKIDAISLYKMSVWSDYTDTIFNTASALAPDTYDKRFSELPILGYYEAGGIGSLSEGSSFSGYDSTSYFTVPGKTLSEQMNWGGVTLKRGESLNLNDYYGEIGFSYNPCVKVAEYQEDYSGTPRTYEVEYVVMLSAEYCVHFTVKNLTFRDNKVYVDIEGEESYGYSIRTDMNDTFHHGMQYKTDDEIAWQEAEQAKYRAFREETEKKVTVEETKRTFGFSGARAVFEVYDVEGRDDKNLIMKVEQSGITLMFLVNGVVPHGSGAGGGTVVKVETPASTETGEVSFSVPVAVLVSVGAGFGALAAAAATGDTSDEKKKGYKMYVAKDFGDAIRKGDPPVTVKARMAEVDENGVEHDRDDLTALITVSGNGLVIDSAAVEGRYVAAKVHADPEDNDTTGSVIFTFTGEGGTFENSVVFRIVGDPYLQFIEDGTEAGTVNRIGNKTSFRAIGGDGFTYKIRFSLVDATEEPKKLSAEENADFTVTFEPDPTYKFTYFAVLKNKSAPITANEGFTKPRISTVYITAEMGDYTGEGTIGAYLYPEGLSVTTDAELDESHTPKSAIATAYEKEYGGDFDAKFTQIMFYYTLAVKTATEAKFVRVADAGLKFGQMVGEGEKNACIAEKYERGKNYKMGVSDDDSGAFEPTTMLWEPLEYTTGIQVYVPVSCEYEGKKYEAKVYIRLRGKDPDPMAEWNAEHEKLIERIKKYVPNEYWHDYLEKVKRISEEPRKGVEDLRLMSKDIVRAYRDYWEAQGKDAQWWANAWDWMTYGAEWTKWIGDCAFSILCNIYGGPLADAILSPAKDVFAAFVGEVGVNIVWGTKFDIENLECFAALRTAGDNIVGNWASDGVKSVLESGSSWKTKAGMIAGALAAYLLYLSVSNYLKQLKEEPEKASLWKAIADGFKDLTANFIKACIGELLGKWLKSDGFREKIGSKIELFVQKYVGGGKTPEVFKKVEMDFLDENGKVVFVKVRNVAESYLSSLCGEGVAKVVEDPTLGIKTDKNGDYVYTFTVTWWDKAPFPVEINLNKLFKNTASGVFTWLYDELCGGLPTASAVAEIPKDPLLPAEAENVKHIPAAN